jgi:surface polysaccharide O-acyltransferase-like enzyme
MQENGPLWFCLALLIFSVVYVAWRVFAPTFTGRKESREPPDSPTLVAFAMCLAVFTFLTRLFFPSGYSFLNMHLGDFPQYILLFAAGILMARYDWLPKLSFARGLKWLLVVLPVGFAAWITLIGTGGMVKGNSSAYSGGWRWQAAGINLWEAFTCVAVCYGLLVIYRKSCNEQGHLEKFLSDNAFSVYVFHPPILILLARSMHSLEWPSLLKFALLTVLSAIFSFGLSATVFRRIPLLQKIL